MSVSYDASDSESLTRMPSRCHRGSHSCQGLTKQGFTSKLILAAVDREMPIPCHISTLYSCSQHTFFFPPEKGTRQRRKGSEKQQKLVFLLPIFIILPCKPAMQIQRANPLVKRNSPHPSHSGQEKIAQSMNSKRQIS